MIIVNHSGNAKDSSASVVNAYRSEKIDICYDWLIELGYIRIGQPVEFSARKKDTVNICMVGDYSEKLPAKRDINALVKILSVECFVRNLQVDKIEIGEGNRLQAHLPKIRQMVAAKLKERNDGNEEKHSKK